MTDEPQDAKPNTAAAASEPSEPLAPATAAAGGPFEAPPPPPAIEPLSADPPAVPAFDPAATGWAAVAATPPKPAGLAMRVVIPLGLLAVAVLVSVIAAYRRNGAPASGYEAGYLVGTIVGVLLGAGIALLIARHFVGRSSPARYRLIASAVALVLAIISSAASIGATIHPAADPSTAMVITTPYTLTAATPDVEKSFANASQGKVAVAVKMVSDASTPNIGILVATEGLQSRSFWTSFDSSFGKSSGGGTTTPTTFHGEPARLFHAKGVSGVAWIEDGSLVIAVYAKSDATAMSIAEAQFQAAAASAPAPSK